LGFGFGIDNLKKYFKIFDRWRCKHIGHSLSLDVSDGRCNRYVAAATYKAPSCDDDDDDDDGVYGFHTLSRMLTY